MPASRMLTVATLTVTTVLALLVASPAKAADYAPLDCTKARSVTEKTICGNYALGQAEARMATLYEWTTQLVAMGSRGNIQDDQRTLHDGRASLPEIERAAKSRETHQSRRDSAQQDEHADRQPRVRRLRRA